MGSIQALTEADHHGVAIRIVLDPRERHDFVALGDLADTVQIKRGGPFMHLKAYSIDGQVLRTGSANFNKITTSSSFATPGPRRSSTRTSSACGMRPSR